MLRPMAATYVLLIAVTAMPATGALAASRLRLMPDRNVPILMDDSGSDENAPRSQGDDDNAGTYGGDSEAAPILPPDVIEPPGCPLDSAPLELIV